LGRKRVFHPAFFVQDGDEIAFYRLSSEIF
jgi:hypothetical protein